MKRLQLLLILLGISELVLSKCTTNDGEPGVCRDQQYCSEESGKICYWEGTSTFICCRESKYTKPRPSQQFCDKAYKFWWPVVNGIATEQDEFPYMVALGWDTGRPNVFDYKCGGVLIGNGFVITAAHCAYVDGVQPVVIKAGGVNLTDTTRRTHRISGIVRHPEYKPKTAYHDIALVKLQDEIYYGACLWTKEELFSKTCTAIGYGHTKFAGRGSNQLLKADLNFVDQTECQEYYEDDDSVPRGILDSQLCAKDPTEFRDTCQGDSGGPIIMKRYQGTVLRPYLVGVISFGQGCAHEPPGVYTRISSYLDWIEEIVWPNGEIKEF